MLSEMTAIHALDNRHAISDVYLLQCCAAYVGISLVNCETVYLPHLSRIEYFNFGYPETSVHKYQPTQHNQFPPPPDKCGRTGQIKYSAPL